MTELDQEVMDLARGRIWMLVLIATDAGHR